MQKVMTRGIDSKAWGLAVAMRAWFDLLEGLLS